MADMSAKIAKARAAGYSDDDILAHLGRDQAVGGRIAKAREAGYSPKAITAFLAKGEQRRPGFWDNLTGAAANFNRGLGIGDEIAAGVRTAADVVTGKTAVTDIPAGYERAMATQRGQEDDFAERAPKTAALAKGFGNATTLAAPTSKLVALPASASRAMNAVRGATTAGLAGAGMAAADRGTVSERVDAAGRTAMDPLTLGLGGLAGATVGRSKQTIVKRKAANLDKLRGERDAAYQAVENAGVRYTPAAMEQMVDGIKADALSARINPMRHPKAAAMLDDLETFKAQSPTLTEVDQLRQVIRRDVAGASDSSEAFFGRRMIRALDDFVSKAGADMVAEGDPQQAAALVTRARELNTRTRKLESVVEAQERAHLRAGSTGSGGNVNNATRQELRRVLEDTPNLSAEEREAFETAIVGTRGDNALRLVGKLSPQGNGLMLGAHTVGTLAVGPWGAVPGVIGWGAKFAADKRVQDRIDNLMRLIASDPGEEAAEKARRLLVAQLRHLNGKAGEAAGRTAVGAGAYGGATAEPRARAGGL